MKRYSILLLFVGAVGVAPAQTYCEPFFANGCDNWHNRMINIGTIEWENLDCYTSDFTHLTTTVAPGGIIPTLVESGAWCGCSVWIDLNDDGIFSDEENMFYDYVGGDPSFAYLFDIQIPANAPPGPHRTRVIAAWGSNGFDTDNGNGSGPCGMFQYGNFNDFTVIVTGGASIDEPSSPLVELLGSNPTDGRVVLSIPDGGVLDRVLVRTLDGRQVAHFPLTGTAGRGEIDLSGQPAGVYMLNCHRGDRVGVVRVVKL